ncbi:HD domain-containing protein [Oribacterium sp. WCC10]|uniref:HD domain-containing protein n=1 Tax=Oribacterium sp. WCC10 TaxID=1855343 RepID=UPI0008E581B9|nr:HD domain-containing protein [Oribacterium sp. WCC10]SFG65519.1 TIGR02172 family protein [Oribacterium sp. WCC10]
MMNKIEEAIIYATVMHQGKVRKFGGKPFILHPLEVAQILSTMTDDEDIITAGILHDIVEDTDGTLSEIEKRFGKRVAFIVSSESEQEYPDEARSATWQRRKEESLLVLKNSQDIGVKMLWLADKLANIRSLAGYYSEHGEKIWQDLHQSDSDMQNWYYRSIGEMVELSLNKTGAFKEYIKHVNFIWPGSFDRDKARYKKYREVSVDGCKCIGRGAKGEVYRYDDELVIKVYNDNNTYRDVEKEISQSRRAFVMGIPTAISFGIVAVGDRYGAMYELLDSETVSSFIAKNPGHVETYAKIMADLARTIHGITISEDDCFPPATDRLKSYIRGGVAREDETLAEKCTKLVDELPDTRTMVHGDFHTGNVFLQNGEPLLIDMDRLSVGHPMAEISDLYYFYETLGENDPAVVEKFMGFSYETAQLFLDLFLKFYFETEDANILNDIKEKASFICAVRMINKIHKKDKLSDKDKELIDHYMKTVTELSAKLDTLAFEVKK